MSAGHTTLQCVLWCAQVEHVSVESSLTLYIHSTKLVRVRPIFCHISEPKRRVFQLNFVQ